MKYSAYCVCFMGASGRLVSVCSHPLLIMASSVSALVSSLGLLQHHKTPSQVCLVCLHLSLSGPDGLLFSFKDGQEMHCMGVWPATMTLLHAVHRGPPVIYYLGLPNKGWMISQELGRAERTPDLFNGKQSSTLCTCVWWCFIVFLLSLLLGQRITACL